jgi:hypothetical protein
VSILEGEQTSNDGVKRDGNDDDGKKLKMTWTLLVGRFICAAYIIK